MPISAQTFRIRIGVFHNISVAFTKNPKSKQNYYSQQNFIVVWFLTCLLFSSVICSNDILNDGNDSYSDYIHKMHNKNMHAKNGNVFKKCNRLKLLHVNKGNANFKTKKLEMRILIDKFTPDIFCVAEANVGTDYKDYINEFDDYTFELNLMYKNIGMSRNIVMIKKGLQYKRRFDLENEIVCNIWIEMNLGTGKSLLLMGGYRQWSLPKCMDFYNKNDSDLKQGHRFEITLENWSKCISEGKDIVVLTDDNVDTSTNASHNKKYKIRHIEKLLNDHINKHGIVLHNKQLTRFESHSQPSILDHIYSNCPSKLTPVETIKNIFSDHSLLKVNYTMSQNMYKPKYVFLRNYRLITKEKMTNYIKNSDELNSIFCQTDPNIIASIIQIEINSIIELIAPGKRTQYKKNYQPYINDTLVKQLKHSQELLEIAINTKNMDSWREYKHFRNETVKNIKIEKKNYITEKLGHNRNKWKMIKEINGNNKTCPPSEIQKGNETITSPKSIANLANNYFIDKI